MRLDHLLADTLRRVAEIERRLDSTIKQGRVVDVDAAKGTVRLRLNEDSAAEAFLSPPIPYAQIAGALKVHTPPSVGQQMTIISGAGDFRQGLAVPMTWSDQNQSPSEKGDEHVLTFGSVRMVLVDDGLKISVGGVSVEITGSGVAVTGGRVEHDGKNIGSSHVHSGIVVGPANTGVPAN
jgi:phage baseplate assembly protein gpV